MDKWVIAFGDYEREQRIRLFETAKLYQRHFSKRVTFVDIGAHWGWYTLMAHKEEIFSRIVCFEPYAPNMDQLLANVFLNGLSSSIESVQAAVAETSGTRSFSPPVGTQRAGGKIADPTIGDPSTPVIPVTTVCLDDYFQGDDSIFVIKIDVEGHEHGVILGAQTLLRNNVCILQIEVFDRNLEQVTSLMNDLGYVLNSRIGDDCLFQRA